MQIDFSPLNPFMDDLFINLLLVLLVPFVLSMVIGFILLKIKIPRNIASTITIFLFIYGAYKTLIMITG
ncbi:hypothetical protein BIV59_18700 [Bacillus sp. MUM 13]|nr:hypothetical protein BIV59_18700 [Bacillus sp. MUM 13]